MDDRSIAHAAEVLKWAADVLDERADEHGRSPQARLLRALATQAHTLHLAVAHHGQALEGEGT